MDVDRSDSMLLMKMMGVAARVEEVLKQSLSVSWFLPSQEDQLRLLVLEGWEEKYRISLDWMLKQLVPYWRSRFTRYRKSKSMGVSIATLIGKKSEEFLRQRILEAYPDGENLLQWKMGEQARQWSVEWDNPPKKEDWENPREVITQYQKRMTVERRERKTWMAKRKRRRYRNNPWIGR